MDPLTAGDKAYRQAMQRGSDELRRAIKACRAGIEYTTSGALVWRRNAQNIFRDPDSKSTANSLAAQERAVEKTERAEAQRAMREPCPRCGTRQDIGCEHVKHLFTAEDILIDKRHLNAAWERAMRGD